MKRRLCGAVAALGITLAVTGLPGQASADTRPGSTRATLPLGSSDLAETRTTQTLQPGLTLTRIVRGAVDPAHHWTVEATIPGGDTSPDPDAPPTTLKDRASADELAADLRGDGFDARSEQVTTPGTADYAGGTLGWRVRIGTFPSQSAATAERTRMIRAGYTGSVTYTGWDGATTDRGPWRLDVLTIDPRTFRGTLDATHGPDIENRETVSALANEVGAVAAVNAGFFVLDPRSGAPGDPAGVGLYDGRLLSEPVSGRPGFVVQDNGRRTQITRLTWEGKVSSRGTSLGLNGVNRVPGLIRNCGGSEDDSPTALPLHDVTCTNPDQLVAFTPEYGASTPQGEGVEAVLDSRGRVLELRSVRGGSLPPGGSSLQATGRHVAALTALARPGERLRIDTTLRDDRGRRVTPGPGTDIVNAGPELVRDGRLHVTPATDGMVHPGDPSWYYGWVHKRNPRTLAGTDASGRTVLVTADGRSTDSLGLSITESAQVARSLGLRDAVNLDGGGSTTMVAKGQVVNVPSDAAGERPVGDALLLLPRRR
ncbi:phosphodiester glycosidase family protein [Streptomyces sp. Vc74B-19]|uniref:phosphodiester glycosidase family protein n=1 Tax=unclassified Streptomyces TaxID=2593676 RepID=UPI001BFC2A6C|nr:MULTISPECIES: phosphodiester glycosidase family protein [unclassified Streptomyces]MBT3166474.1 phosphodiester glycosidase family protein [Streptomyces sp. Vc74B-19]MCO4698148.1 phosphodiester glycosidase family protein [Streptomyces sp. RO-S4]